MKVRVRFEQVIEMIATIEVTESDYDRWRRTAEPNDLSLAEFLRSGRDQDALELNLVRANQREGGSMDVIDFTLMNATAMTS